MEKILLILMWKGILCFLCLSMSSGLLTKENTPENVPHLKGNDYSVRRFLDKRKSDKEPSMTIRNRYSTPPQKAVLKNEGNLRFKPKNSSTISKDLKTTPISLFSQNKEGNLGEIYSGDGITSSSIHGMEKSSSEIISHIAKDDQNSDLLSENSDTYVLNKSLGTGTESTFEESKSSFTTTLNQHTNQSANRTENEISDSSSKSLNLERRIPKIRLHLRTFHLNNSKTSPFHKSEGILPKLNITENVPETDDSLKTQIASRIFSNKDTIKRKRTERLILAYKFYASDNNETSYYALEPRSLNDSYNLLENEKNFSSAEGGARNKMNTAHADEEKKSNLPNNETVPRTVLDKNILTAEALTKTNKLLWNPPLLGQAMPRIHSEVPYDKQENINSSNNDTQHDDPLKDISEEHQQRNDENLLLTDSFTASSTLPSIFNEDLIPPWHSENQRSNDVENLRTNSTDIMNENNSEFIAINSETGAQEDDEVLTRPISTKISPVLNDNNDVNSSDATQLNKNEAPVAGAGKADFTDKEHDVQYTRERINFVTLPPSSHWRIWEYAERRRVDPFFEFNTANMTRDVTQVYTAYWSGVVNPSYKEEGIWILRAGSGLALLALVVTVTAQSVKYCQPHLCQKAILITNLATSLATAHVVFIFGIEATRGSWACGVVSLLLHFLHLLSCNWILALSVRLLRALLQKSQIPCVAFCFPVWLASIVTVVVSYAYNPSGYETYRFCWLSVEKGMLVAFIAPVCTLLLVNAGVCVASQKVLLDSGTKGDPMDKADMRAGVVLLPLQGIAWFLMIVALEDEFSLALDFAAAVATATVGFLTLNFYVPGWVDVCEQVSCAIPFSCRSRRSVFPAVVGPDTAQLPLLHQQNPTAGCTCINPTNPALLEEFQLEPLLLDTERRDAY